MPTFLDQFLSTTYVGFTGSQGVQGLQGPLGQQGIQGRQGIQGVQGFGGIQGAVGQQGIQGGSGPQGIQGIQGFEGTQGTAGSQGTQGDAGSQGTQGTLGIQGAQGNIGQQGVQGADGQQGIQGIIGSQGIQGIDGAFAAQGIQGIQGIQGTGADGSQGIQGTQGTTGQQGLQGITGQQGVQGIQGTLPAGTLSEWKGARRTFTAFQPSSTGSWVRVTLASATVDTNSFSNGTNGFTIPAGVSRIRLTASVVQDSGSTPNNQWTIFKNDAQLSIADGSFRGEIDMDGYTNGGITVSSGILSVVQGDIFDLRTFVNIGTIPYSGWFEIEVVEGSVLGTFFGGVGAQGIQGIQGTVGSSSVGPTFSAGGGGAVTIPANTETKVTFTVEEFDSANCYNTSTSRFTPNVAGYYLINASVSWSTTVSSPMYIVVAKNGVAYKRGDRQHTSLTAGLGISTLVYLNGSTDYVEIFAFNQAGTGTTEGTVETQWFNGAFIRS